MSKQEFIGLWIKVLGVAMLMLCHIVAIGYSLYLWSHQVVLASALWSGFTIFIVGLSVGLILTFVGILLMGKEEDA